ncbi:hypothetical protein G5714_001559 [Onychostoma macrolepis]|uniref:Uncharacterized protein n=1 Tax=Onychostoma macrolepis TaxID=369639 RepID=A0A7J6DCG6_9TELE|nr:hypothetical protein G5714_001559 [Onychostoma macrolepis]
MDPIRCAVHLRYNLCNCSSATTILTETNLPSFNGSFLSNRCQCAIACASGKSDSTCIIKLPVDAVFLLLLLLLDLMMFTELAEPDESLELASGAQSIHRTSKDWGLTLKEHGAPTRHRDRRTTKRTSKSPSHKQVNLPRWLVNLMRDIEEATTHELTIE